MVLQKESLGTRLLNDKQATEGDNESSKSLNILQVASYFLAAMR